MIRRSLLYIARHPNNGRQAQHTEYRAYSPCIQVFLCLECCPNFRGRHRNPSETLLLLEVAVVFQALLLNEALQQCLPLCLNFYQRT